MTTSIRKRFGLEICVAILGLHSTCYAGDSAKSTEPGERPPGCSIGVLTCSEDFVSEVTGAIQAAPNAVIREKLNFILKSFDAAEYTESLATVIHLKQVDDRAELQGIYQSWGEYLKNILYPPKPPGYRSSESSQVPWGKRKMPPASDRLRHIQWLYEGGVEAYARRDLLSSMSFFQRILNLDPDNTSAARAMRRVRSELDQSAVGAKKGAP